MQSEMFGKPEAAETDNENFIFIDYEDISVPRRIAQLEAEYPLIPGKRYLHAKELAVHFGGMVKAGTLREEPARRYLLARFTALGLDEAHRMLMPGREFCKATGHDFISDLLTRDGSICSWCKEELPPRNEMTKANVNIDHKVPVSKGGNAEPKNLQLLHQWCNSEKSTS